MKEDITSKLIDYLEGTLSEVEKKEIELALSTSAEYRAELASLREVLNVYDGQEDHLPSSNLRSRFYDFLENEESVPLKKSPGKIIYLVNPDMKASHKG